MEHWGRLSRHIWILIIPLIVVCVIETQRRLFLDWLLWSRMLLLFDFGFKGLRCGSRYFRVIIVSLLVELVAQLYFRLLTFRNMESLGSLCSHFWVIIVSLWNVLEAKFQVWLLLLRLLCNGVLLLFDLRFESWRCGSRYLLVIIVSVFVKSEA